MIANTILKQLREDTNFKLYTVMTYFYTEAKYDLKLAYHIQFQY
jgi:hypothetical protein